jgi:hypothetical protein
MTRLFVVAIAGIVALGLPALIPKSMNSEPFDYANPRLENVIISATQHFLVMPPKQVMYGLAEKGSARSDSRYVAFAGTPMTMSQMADHLDPLKDPKPLQHAIYTYDLQSQNLRKVEGLPYQKFEFIACSFVDSSPYLKIIGSTENEQSTWLFHPEQNRLIAIPDKGISPDSVDPTYSVQHDALVGIGPSEETFITFTIFSLRNMTTTKVKVNVPKNSYLRTEFGRFYFCTHDENFEDIAISEVDPATGRLRPMNRMLQSEFQDIGPLMIQQNPFSIAASEEDNEQARPSRAQSVPLGLNVSHAALTPNYRYAYLSNSSGFSVTEIKSLSSTAYERLKFLTVRNKALENAKIVGTGLMIYAADYDDLLPLTNNWSESIIPYITNKNLTSGFTYVGNGQNLSEMDDKTIIGMIETPYGVATVTATGSVTWKEKPKVELADRARF